MRLETPHHYSSQVCAIPNIWITYVMMQFDKLPRILFRDLTIYPDGSTVSIGWGGSMAIARLLAQRLSKPALVE